MKNELQNIYLNYKLDFIRADEIPNYIIDLLSKNIINDMIFWEIASLNKPYKNEIEDYFNILIAKKLLDEINDKLLIEISSYWWSCNLINNDKFLSVIENKKNTTSILRKDIEYFIYINYCDWDYEFKIKKEIKDILKKSIYYEVFDSFNLLKMNGETSSEAIHNETLIIKKKKLELKHIFLFICALPVFLFYIILTSIKYFKKKNNQMKLTIEDLKNQNLILFECISGSKAYNLATKNSDTDIRGVFYLPKTEFYGFDYQTQVSNETNDIVYYEIGRFIELLLKNNPSCLELLATPEEFILYKSPFLTELNYKDFITSEVEKTFVGYALSQIKKAKGLNKKFLNPIDEVRKTVLDFCYIIDENKTISFIDWMDSNAYKQEFCGLSKINHSKDLFVLYYNEKSNYKGIAKDENNDDIRLSEIPKNEKPIAYFIFQKDEYSTYCKQYKEYWDWIKLRNKERYKTNIAHKKNYDSKNMMHTIRLLKVAKELVETGNLNVKRTEDCDELLAIKNGDFSYEEVIEKTEKLQREIEEKSKLKRLPSEINSSKMEDFLINLRIKLYENN